MAGTVLLLDATTGGTRTSRSFDYPNHNAAFSPDGKEIWTAQMATQGKVLVLDAATLETKKTLDVGDSPAEVTFTVDGKYAFVANGMSNSVSVFDASAKTLAKTITVGTDPVGAWPGKDTLMYVDNESAKTITAIHGKTLEVVRTYALGFTPGMAATAPNGDLWVTDTDNGKVVFFPAGSAVKSGDLLVGAGAHGIAFSRDGKTAYVSNQAAGTVSVIDVGIRTVKGTVPVGDKPNGMVIR
jgi:YVTN family beta-propeller protein